MKAITLQTRKPVEQLTLDDFAAFPIWEYADDEEGTEGMDETWVRPVDAIVVPKRSYTHVAARFKSPIGSEFDGFVTVDTLNGLPSMTETATREPPEVCQGTIFFGRESLFVSNPEAICFEMSRGRLLASLGLTESGVFPLTFQLRVLLPGEKDYFCGTLP